MSSIHPGEAYLAALAKAERRAQASYFDQHIVEARPGEYLILDEGDYGMLPAALIDRIVHSLPGGRIDDY